MKHQVLRGFTVVFARTSKDDTGCHEKEIKLTGIKLKGDTLVEIIHTCNFAMQNIIF